MSDISLSGRKGLTLALTGWKDLTLALAGRVFASFFACGRQWDFSKGCNSGQLLTW